MNHQTLDNFELLSILQIIVLFLLASLHTYPTVPLLPPHSLPSSPVLPDHLRISFQKALLSFQRQTGECCSEQSVF